MGFVHEGLLQKYMYIVCRLMYVYEGTYVYRPMSMFLGLCTDEHVCRPISSVDKCTQNTMLEVGSSPAVDGLWATT